jgi:hypothetical protein
LRVLIDKAGAFELGADDRVFVAAVELDGLNVAE